LQEHGASAQQAAAVLGRQVAHQAYFQSALDLFFLSTIVTVALLPLIWLTRKASQGGHAAGGE
jgi:hypothetical protein